MSAQEKACRLIAASSVLDFTGAIAWGQWCREMAIAGRDGDQETLDWNRQKIDKQRATQRRREEQNAASN